MKSSIYSLPLLLVVNLFLETSNAASIHPKPPLNALPGTNLTIPDGRMHFNNHLNPAISEKNDARVFPNPCNGQFTLSFYSSIGGKMGITVFDANGNGVIAIEYVALSGNNRLPIDITGYGKGMFSLSVSGAGVFTSIPVIVK